MGDNPPYYELFADRTRPPLEVVHDMKLLRLTIDESPCLLKPMLNLYAKRLILKFAALRRVRKFIPSEVMVNIYKAFILPHLEYCTPVLAGLSSGLSNKLELTNQYVIRTLMNTSKLASYSDLRTHVDLKNLRASRIFSCSHMTLEAFVSFISLSITR